MLRTSYNGGVYPDKICKIEDVDYDGDNDLICHFRTLELDIMPEEEALIIMGRTLDGIPFEGIDMIRPVFMEPCE